MPEKSMDEKLHIVNNIIYMPKKKTNHSPSPAGLTIVVNPRELQGMTNPSTPKLL
jgi:hypothetical protein